MLYFLRAAYLLIHFLAVCTYAVIYCLIFPRRLNNTSKLARMMSWSIPIIGINLIHKNKSPLPISQAGIYVSNHQHTLDIFLHPSIMPDNIAILGKSGLRYVPIFGLAFWLAGNIFINRSDKAKARATMTQVSKIIRERGNSLYMFPEGTRSRGKGLLPFKKGAFALAIESGLPIVPVVFSTIHTQINLGHWKAGTVITEFLEPIDTRNMTQADVPTLLAQTRALIEEGIERLDQEIDSLASKDSA